ncbi:hypothetical protein F2P81_014236 [Scophthalmus maximus]|uniref:Uncharacterized protein n=1 Tax=Scophthalmus maximus TaxID=52904 RepID=A0A6A4SQJ4_SCOMX|nr:hypothetical protein F2P81_014236 [Scophthalmus maximus]
MCLREKSKRRHTVRRKFAAGADVLREDAPQKSSSVDPAPKLTQGSAKLKAKPRTPHYLMQCLIGLQRPRTFHKLVIVREKVDIHMAVLVLHRGGSAVDHTVCLETPLGSAHHIPGPQTLGGVTLAPSRLRRR